jgi:hypothetical protein
MFLSGAVNSSVSMLSSDDLGLHEPMMPWIEAIYVAHFNRLIDDGIRSSIASLPGVSVISYIPYDTFLFAASSPAVVTDVRALPHVSWATELAPALKLSSDLAFCRQHSEAEAAQRRSDSLPTTAPGPAPDSSVLALQLHPSLPPTSYDALRWQYHVRTKLRVPLADAAPPAGLEGRSTILLSIASRADVCVVARWAASQSAVSAGRSRRPRMPRVLCLFVCLSGVGSS